MSSVVAAAIVVVAAVVATVVVAVLVPAVVVVTVVVAAALHHLEETVLLPSKPVFLASPSPSTLPGKALLLDYTSNLPLHWRKCVQSFGSYRSLSLFGTAALLLLLLLLLLWSACNRNEVFFAILFGACYCIHQLFFNSQFGCFV